MKTYLPLLLMLITATAWAQPQTRTYTDLRLRTSAAQPGVYAFRHAGDGDIVSYNTAGVETARWDAETGHFTGTAAGGGGGEGPTTLPAANITAGTLSTDVKVTNGSIMTMAASKLTGALPAIDGSALTNVAAATFTGNIPISQVTNLQTELTNFTSALAGKANTVHPHVAADITDLGDVLMGYVDMDTYAIDMAGKANADHPHAIADVTNLQTTLDAKAPLASPTFTGTITGNGSGLTNVTATALTGNIPISQVTNLQTALSGFATDINTLATTKAPIANPTFTGTITGNGSGLTNLPAGNLTGTISTDRLPVVPTTKGGTGLSTLGSAGQVLRVNSGATGMEWGTVVSGGGTWGSITGTLSNQTDLNTALAGKGGLAAANTWTGMNAFTNDVEFVGTASFDSSITVEGTVGAVGFDGDGSGLTNLPATSLTGTISTDRLPVVPTTKGGTGLSAFGAAGQVLRVNAGANGLEWGTVVSGGGTWGSITGTLSNQTDLNTALAGKSAITHSHSLSGLEDTSIPVFPNDGEILTWDSATNNWLAKPAPVPPSTAWGSITGTLSNQTDLNSALAGKENADSDLTALAGLATTGLITRTGTGAMAARTITGTANLITVTNNNGVSGNPTITVGANVARRDMANTFTGNQTVNGTLTATALAGGGAGITDLTKAQVGLSNVDNTSDASKPVSTAMQTALDAKAPIASPTFTGTVTAPAFVGDGSGLTNLPSTGGAYTSADEVYEVSPDGSRDFTTIQAAVAAATDPAKNKLIYVHPGTYNLPDETGIHVTVPNTHIMGANRDSVTVIGSLFLGDTQQGYWEALVTIKASDCSVRNMTIQNTSKSTWRTNYKATTVMVGEMTGLTDTTPVTGVRIENVRSIGRTGAGVDAFYGGWSYDVIWVCQNAVDTLINDCEVHGFSDIISVSGEATIKNTIVYNRHAVQRGFPFWSAKRIDSPYSAKINLHGITVKGKLFAYLVFGGDVEAVMSDVQVVDNFQFTPDYYVVTVGTTNNVLYLGGNVSGIMPTLTAGSTVNSMASAGVSTAAANVFTAKQTITNAGGLSLRHQDTAGWNNISVKPSPHADPGVLVQPELANKPATIFIMPKTAGTMRTSKVAIFGTDYWDDPVNFLQADVGYETYYGDAFWINSRGNGTWTARDIALAWNSSEKLRITTAGTRIGTNGTPMASLISATQSLDFTSIAANQQGVMTMTVTGAASGDAVVVTPPSTINAGLTWSGVVSAANTVQVRLANSTSAAIDPAAMVWRAVVMKF